MATIVSAEEAVKNISSGQRVFVHGGAATPLVLLEALYKRAEQLHNVEFIHLHLEGAIPYSRTGFKKSFSVANLFLGPNARESLDYEAADYLPYFLSEMPELFRKRRRPVDAALIHVSPPDRHGFCTLGTSVDIARAAVDTAPMIIAQINPNMPRVHGDGFIHIKDIDYAVEIDTPILEGKLPKATDLEICIGKYVAGLIEDGSTLQIGIGKIPSAVIGQLTGHKHLGIHTEVWSDALLPLIETGVIDNSQKHIHPGKSVSTFAIGTTKLYDYIHDNPSVVHLDVAYTNNPEVIGRNDRVVAINSAVEIDLTGQVCADSVGPRVISGIGGQMDFIRGSAISKGGKSIIAITSRTPRGESKIVSFLKRGAGVVTTRGHIHYVATEYGIADLHGKTMGERAKALISIAHPEDRERLEKEWQEYKKLAVSRG